MSARPPFELRSSYSGDVLTVALAGELDMSTAASVEQAIAAAADSTRLVVAELSAVTFLDSSGLNTLVRGRRALAARGIRLRIVSPSDQAVHRVFEITRLIDALDLVETLEEALA